MSDLNEKEKDQEPNKEHSSHRVHRGSGHHSKSKKRKFKHKLKKAWAFFKKKKYLILNVIVFILLVLLLYLTSLKVIKNDHTAEKAMNDYVSANTGLDDVYMKTLSLDLPVFIEPVTLITEAAQSYMDADTVQQALANIEPFRQGRLDLGKAVKISYNVGVLPKGLTIDSSLIEVSENEDFSNAKDYPLGLGDRSAEIYYLKTGTHYYYRITLNLSTGNRTSAIGEFYTADTPRILTVDGICNVRDIGGWKTTDGKVIKQGMLIRGTEMDGAVVPSYKLTTQGARGFGIVSDMDLRKDDEVRDPLSAIARSVYHDVYNATTYDGIFEPTGMQTTADIFAALADPSRYPVYMHCTYGRDRTGTICYLLEGLLGLSEEDLLREYYLTGLYYPDLDGSGLNVMIDKLKSDYEGETMQEKITAYLITAGVTQDQIDSIKSIFLENEK